MECEQLKATIDRECQLTGMNQLLDSVISNTTATDTEKQSLLEKQVDKLRRCWKLHYDYLKLCAVQQQNSRISYITPRAVNPFRVDYSSLDRIYYLVDKCLHALLDIQNRFAEQAVTHIEEVNTMPNGLNLLNALQQRYIERQRSLLNQYETTTDRSAKDTLRQQLMKCETEIQKKNQEIGVLQQQIRSDKFKLQILSITMSEIDRIGKERREAQEFFNKELFDLNIHAI
jgi:hypothetical protein